MLNKLILSNDISYMTEDYIKLHVDGLGRFYVSKHKISSARHDTPQEAKLEWHKKYRKVRRAGKYKPTLDEYPDYVALDQLHYLIDFRFKSGFDGVSLVNETEYKGTATKNGMCVLTKHRKNPAECAWDIHTMLRVSVMPDACIVITGNVKDEDIAYMRVLDKDKSGDDCSYRSVYYYEPSGRYYGTYSINSVRKQTPGVGTAREAAWILHNLRLSGCIDSPQTAAVKRIKNTNIIVQKLRAETAAAIDEYRDSLRNVACAPQERFAFKPGSAFY